MRWAKRAELFSIGLKLRVRSLLRPEIWAGTSAHTVLIIALFSMGFIGLAAVGIPRFTDLSYQTAALIAFALSFSSTVFAVKSLEENGEMGSVHGRIAIGILIMQDVLAVLFLTFSTGKIPSVWAVAVLGALLLLRPAMSWIITRSGHGELVTLCGLFFALVAGAKGFESVGLKADLGALFVGILVGQHPKSKELSKSLGSIIDILLIGFFLSIGLKGLPDWTGLGIALGLSLLLPLKSVLLLGLLTRFHLRVRTSWMSTLTLATYSEFGLIVMAVGVKKEWVGAEWLTIVAIALSLSIFAAAPLNRVAEQLYEKFVKLLHPLETAGRSIELQVSGSLLPGTGGCFRPRPQRRRATCPPRTQRRPSRRDRCGLLEPSQNSGAPLRTRRARDAETQRELTCRRDIAAPQLQWGGGRQREV